MAHPDMDRKIRIIESNYGRDHGWYLEHHGSRLAVLTQPKWADMFWVSYRFEPATDDLSTLALLESDEFWRSCDYVFRNRVFRDEVVDRAFGQRGRQPDELTVRGLYLDIEEPTFWEEVRYFRRLRRARRHRNSTFHRPDRTA